MLLTQGDIIRLSIILVQLVNDGAPEGCILPKGIPDDASQFFMQLRDEHSVAVDIPKNSASSIIVGLTR